MYSKIQVSFTQIYEKRYAKASTRAVALLVKYTARTAILAPVEGVIPSPILSSTRAALVGIPFISQSEFVPPRTSKRGLKAAVALQF